MLNALNVSGVRENNSKGFRTSGQNDSSLANSGQVNDKVIDDIQRRLELLDEFK